MDKKWVFLDSDQDAADALHKDAGVSPILAQLLVNRGVRAVEGVENILGLSKDCIYDPFLLKDMDVAVKLIRGAVGTQKITIYGDYDVDGVSATSILVMHLSQMGAEVDYYIPDRVLEGYGLNCHALDKIKASGTKLVITVDTGIAAVKEAEYAKQIGLDIIITDHHQCQDVLPKPDALINPHREDSGYPFLHLAGVGVAFKLICALEGAEKTEQMLQRYSEFVALGTVADIVSLTGENRYYVAHGTAQMTNSKNVGIAALISASGVGGRKITATSVAFGLAPRINAAGRLGDARRGVQLLLEGDAGRATELAKILCDENKNRQAQEVKILKDINEQFATKEVEKVVVASGASWNHGVIGIVASRICERNYRPTLLISIDGGMGKGSGRSVRGFDLFRALNQHSELFEKFGGHEMAVGFSIKPENIAALEYNLNEYAKTNLTDDMLCPQLKIDCKIAASDVTLDTVRDVERLEPYGAGNNKPIFALCGAVIKNIRQLSEGKHIKLSVTSGGKYIDVIGFNMGRFFSDFFVGDVIDIAATLDINEFNGRTSVQLMMADMRQAI